MNALSMALLSALGVSLLSLIGFIAIPLSDQRLRQVTFFLVSLAMGGLFGDVIFHLLPEVYQSTENAVNGSLGIFLGIVFSFTLEKFLRWKHGHGMVHDHGGHLHAHPVEPVGRILLISDGFHNLLDGLLIGASYLISPAMGMATTVAVLLHEIPHELGDFGILVEAGYSRGRAIALNFAFGCMSLVGVIIAFSLGQHLAAFSHFTLAVTAGFFLYIAGANLTPEMQKEHSPVRSLLQLFGMILGAGLMWLLLALD